MKSVYLAATFALIVLTGKGIAHEFWIDPEDYTLAAGEPLLGDLRVGQDFSGAALSYLPRNFETFDVIADGEALPVDGRLGDVPALNVAELPAGLAVVVHQTAGQTITWSEWERFLNFANHKDLGDVTAMHVDRELSQDDVTEDYIRYAKSLVAIEYGTGADRRVGLRAELVALTNPYMGETGDGMRMELWYDGALQPDYQVELFAEDDDGDVEITLHRTDGDGIVTLPVEPGITYMADAVFLEPVEPSTEGGAIWVTHWANMTFAVPE
ncbi:DUF4198 domain-containing protein [Gymnodinialimonas sp. 2305UL16-5]|uniref:DUF4198 domain-containing protein n=1 Tax=Gymnodinialimonas mytili TaxID=3126503 RepID=UPI0030A82D33